MTQNHHIFGVQQSSIPTQRRFGKENNEQAHPQQNMHCILVDKTKAVRTNRLCTSVRVYRATGQTPNETFLKNTTVWLSAVDIQKQTPNRHQQKRLASLTHLTHHGFSPTQKTGKNSDTAARERELDTRTAPRQVTAKARTPQEGLSHAGKRHTPATTTNTSIIPAIVFLYAAADISDGETSPTRPNEKTNAKLAGAVSNKKRDAHVRHAVRQPWPRSADPRCIKKEESNPQQQVRFECYRLLGT